MVKNTPWHDAFIVACRILAQRDYEQDKTIDIEERTYEHSAIILRMTVTSGGEHGKEKT